MNNGGEDHKGNAVNNMKWSVKVARIFGIDIEVHATFLLILALGAFQWGGEYGAPGAVFGMLLMLLLFACVVLHELGHSIVAKILGLPVRQILLLPIGGVSKLEKNPERPVHEFLIAVTGPIINLIIATILLLSTGASKWIGSLNARGLVDGQPMKPSGEALLLWIIAANISLAIFNMIPAFPLDGGRVFRSLLAMFIGFPRATRFASALGQLIAIGVGLFGILSGNLLLTLIALFIFLEAGHERAEEQARTVLTTLRVGDVYNKYALTLAPGDQVSQVVDYLLTSYQPDFAVVQGTRLLGVVTRNDVLKALAAETQDVYVAGIMEREVLSAEGSMPLDDVRRLMQGKGTRIAAVYDGEKYLGLISLDDIAEAILVSAYVKNQEMRRAAEASSQF